MAQYYERETLLKAICRGCNEEFSDAPCEPSDCLLLREIQSLPTADVVPKSVVEELKKDRYQILPDGRLELLPRTDIDAIKAEVAREIISDMRKLINGYENIDIYLDRIEKKYTEEKKDG